MKKTSISTQVDELMFKPVLDYADLKDHAINTECIFSLLLWLLFNYNIFTVIRLSVPSVKENDDAI